MSLAGVSFVEVVGRYRQARAFWASPEAARIRDACAVLGMSERTYCVRWVLIMFGPLPYAGDLVLEGRAGDPFEEAAP